MYKETMTKYIPTKENIKNCYGKNGTTTNKGKNASSYTRDEDGNILPCWIKNLNGLSNTIKLIKKYIDNDYDYIPISAELNISPATCKNFILKNLSIEYINKEKNLRKNNSSLRRSLKIKGKKSPLKGKTYLEIFGDIVPTCGFKRGFENPNFTREKFIGCKVQNSSGKKFRSSYEVCLSEILEKNNICYNYEHHYKLCNGSVKIVDFIIKECLVEVTGYAYPKWKNDFDVKINLLNKSYPEKQIVVISTENNTKELNSKHGTYVHVLSLSDEQKIIDYFLNK